jgi:hypothetical protein
MRISAQGKVIILLAASSILFAHNLPQNDTRVEVVCRIVESSNRSIADVRLV